MSIRRILLSQSQWRLPLEENKSVHSCSKAALSSWRCHVGTIPPPSNQAAVCHLNAREDTTSLQHLCGNVCAVNTCICCTAVKSSALDLQPKASVQFVMQDVLACLWQGKQEQRTSRQDCALQGFDLCCCVVAVLVPPDPLPAGPGEDLLETALLCPRDTVLLLCWAVFSSHVRLRSRLRMRPVLLKAGCLQEPGWIHCRWRALLHHPCLRDCRQIGAAVPPLRVAAVTLAP